MTKRAGMWIDHRHTFIALVTDDDGELAECLEREGLDARILAVETVDKMTDRQIAAKVRQCFLARNIP